MTNHTTDIPTVDVECPPCIMCGRASVVTVTLDGFNAWKAGAFVQVAFPEMDADRREQLISGTHPACWDRMFSEEED